MGLKNKFNKMKSFLFDDEEEKEVPKVSKKVKEKKEIINEELPVSNTIDFAEDYSPSIKSNDLDFEDVSDNYAPSMPEVKSRSERIEKTEKDFQFPQFNDEDFYVVPKKEEIKPIVKKEEPKVALYQGSKRKEEIKKFKPSPFISPVYGLLDNEGNTVKKETSLDSGIDRDEISIDAIRKKAYGSYENDIDDAIENLNSKTLEEAEKEFETKRKEVSKEKEKNVHIVKEIKKESIESNEEDDDDMILPNVNLKEINLNSTSSSLAEDDDDDDTKEQDLFNLIDTMYSKGEKDDD